MAQILRYVNTDNVGTEDGTTVATGYKLLSTWEANEAQNLTDGGGDTMVVRCSGTTADATVVTVDGWTTGSGTDITIEGNDSEADGTNFTSAFSSSYYRLTSSTGSVNRGMLTIQEDYVTVRKLQFEIVSDPNGATRCIEYALVGASNKLNVLACRFKDSSPNTSNRFDHHALHLNDADQIVDVFGCDIEWKHYFVDYAIYVLTSGTINLYGNTIEGASDGVYISSGFSSGTITIKDCTIFNSNTSDVSDNKSGGTVTYDYNATDDSGPRGASGVDISPGGTEATDWAAAVTDYANGDYSVKDSSSVLYDAGTALGLDYDVIGTARPQGAAYDIGSRELIVASSGSVGTGLTTGITLERRRLAA